MCEGWYDDKKGCLDRVDIHGDTISGSIKGLKPLLQGVDHHCHFDHATPAEDEAQSTTPGYLDDSWTTHLPIDHPQNAYPDPDAYFDLDPDQTGMRYSMMIHNLIKPPPSDLSPELKIYTGATPQTRTRWFITLPKCYDKTRIRWIRINHVINMVIGLVMIRIPEHFDEMVGIRQGEGENAGEGLRWINWVVQ
ncbi:hypothetical protein L486_06488 [Kwoniella mangroviensis CBS 10435]|uniref:Uncharacterized protein n=1 Tax=Kwoniella mangroviensis CBS 10435 TaxID=1331196 RepID=A0A1B9IJS1_9TREE|nr:hypothetical protein L486_06488 [Kwoniella mangroviensis CBS 10435]